MASISSYEHPYITVDGIVLKPSYSELDGYGCKKMQWDILLVKRNFEPCLGKWSFPGGFMDIDKNLEETLYNKLFNKAGLVDYYMEQLKTFDAVDRDERGRVLTVAYLVLINEYKGVLPDNACWFHIDNEILINDDGEKISFDDMAFDHGNILREGLERIRGKIWYSDIASYLLPPEFTIKEAQDLFELAEKKRTGSFQRQLGNRVSRVKNKRLDTKGRPAQIYHWNKKI